MIPPFGKGSVFLFIVSRIQTPIIPVRAIASGTILGKGFDTITTSTSVPRGKRNEKETTKRKRMENRLKEKKKDEMGKKKKKKERRKKKEKKDKMKTKKETKQRGKRDTVKRIRSFFF